MKSTDFLRRLISPAEGQGGVTMSYLCPSCNSFPTEQRVVGFSWEEALQLVVRCQCQSGCGVQSACGAARCVCGNLVNALKLLANQPKDGDSPIQSIVAGFCERSRNSIMEGLRHFIEKQRQSSRSEHRCMQLCSMQPAFTAWWKIGRTVMSSSRTRKKS